MSTAIGAKCVLVFNDEPEAKLERYISFGQYNDVDAGAIPSNQYMSYKDLWRAINTTYSFGLCEHLRSANVYDSNIRRYCSDDRDRVKRLKVGRIFWGAVSKHILSRRATIVGIRNAGYNAVRAAVAKGKL